MAMRRLLKNQFKAISLANNQTLRGGHGWDRPDVPLDLNPLYVHKRELSIFDSNMWMYDQVFPEYVISYNEIFLRDQWGAIKESLSQQAYIAVILSVIAGIYYFNAAPRQLGLDSNNAKTKLNDYYGLYQKRSALRPNFLGLSASSDKNFISPSYDYMGGLRGINDDQAAEVNQRVNINLEAKNFIQKIEKECEARAIKAAASAKPAHH